MREHFEPTLTEEQLAAYMDGMLTTEQSSMVEEMIAADPALQEIEESIDEIDNTLIAYDDSQEIPIECLADDFELPVVMYNYETDSVNVSSDMLAESQDIVDYPDLEDYPGELTDMDDDGSTFGAEGYDSTDFDF